MPKNDTIIVRRESEQTESLRDEVLQNYAEDSDDEISSLTRMLAVVLLAFLVAMIAGLLGLLGLIIRLSQI